MKKTKNILNDFFESKIIFSLTLIMLISVIVVIVLYPNIVAQKYCYKIGDIAKIDIKAKKDFLVTNAPATNLKKKLVRDSVLSVYDYNVNLASALDEKVNDAFLCVRKIFEESGDMTQAKDKSAFVWAKKKEFEKKIGISISDNIYKMLEKEKFSHNITEYINIILSKIFENGVVANKDILLNEADKGIILKPVNGREEEIAESLKRFYSMQQAKVMVRIIGKPILKDVNHNITDSVVDIAQNLIKPNITFNASETEKRRAKAEKEVVPVKDLVKTDEMIIREGEKVSESHLVKLDAIALDNNRNQTIRKGIGSAFLIISLLLVIYFIYFKYLPKDRAEANKNLFFVASVFIIFFVIIKISSSISLAVYENANISLVYSDILFGIPLAAGAMIICLFLGMNTAMAFSIIISICAGIIIENGFEFFIYFLLSGFISSFWTKDCKEHKSLIKAGAKIGLFNALFAIVINLYNTDDLLPKLFWDLGFAFSGGITSGIITVGMAPIVEIIFGYNTYMKLLGLANLESPILKRLMIEAPGTYHHSIIVSSMAEAAASAIGANPLLAKVCGYYHDIGKIEKADYFIENQRNGKNLHNKLSPSMSGLILVAHVKNGVKFAKQYKLGKDIINAISQHHGTSLISYFYNKAKQQKGEDAVNIEDFRYPGPTPQTKEAGIIMLADVVEAASRTLENPTHSRIRGFVQDIINKIFSDGQLDNCELTLKDFHKIAKSFITILNGIYHHRIEYPDSVSSGNGKKKVKDGDSDKDRTKETQNKREETPEKDKGILKRLGLSKGGAFGSDNE